MSGLRRISSVLCLVFVLAASWAAGPSPRIVRVYEGQRAFLQAARAAPDATLLELHQLYRELALSPYADVCAPGYAEAFLQSYAYPGRAYESAWIEAIAEIGAAEVAGLVREAVAAASRQLSTDPLTICVLALPPNDRFVIDRMGGVVGSASSSTLHLQVYPTEGWVAKVKYTVAHEYHHAAWFQRLPNRSGTFTLLDYLVFEGRADSFAKMLYPGAAAPWTDALTAGQEKEQWSALQPLLASQDYDLHGRVMFGGSFFGGGYPVWTGYTIGFNIVQAFLENNPGVPVETWTTLDARTILERGDYAP